MKSLLLLIFFIFCLRLLPAQPIIHITPTGAGNRSGTSWTNALSGTDLPSQLLNGQLGTQFWIAAGTYKSTITADRTASFIIKSGVSVYGGFSGTEETIEQRTVGTNETIFSGEIGDERFYTDNTQSVVKINNAEGDVIIDGITVRDGYIEEGDNDYTQTGGIISASGSGINVQVPSTKLRLQITNCRFIRNRSAQGSSDGGAIRLTTGYGGTCKMLIRKCFFLENNAANGGAIVLTPFHEPVLAGV